MSDYAIPAVSRLNTEANQWNTDLPDMNEAREFHSAIVIDIFLFVLGGWQNYRQLGSIEFFELLTGSEWTPKIEDAEIVKRQSASVLVYGRDQIAVFGGVKVLKQNKVTKAYPLDDYILDTLTYEITPIPGKNQDLKFTSQTQTVKLSNSFATVGKVDLS